MIVTPIRYDFVPSNDSGGRSRGLHLGAVVNRYGLMTGILKPGSQSDSDELGAQLQFEKGFIWEDVFTKAFALREVSRNQLTSRRCVYQQEQMRDGIYGTPDCIDLDEELIEEYKCSIKNADKIDALEVYFPLWLMQIMGYCSMVGVNRARLIPLFLAGNRRPPFPQIGDPPGWARELEFTDRELDDNWSKVLSIAEDMR